MRSATASLVCVTLVLPLPAGLAGQELPVRQAPSSSPRPACPPERPVRDAESPTGSPEADARELARSATEAALLGEPEEARDLLRRATELEPRSANLAYRRARAHDELDETREAVRWYCQYLALKPVGEDDRRVRSRLEELGDEAGPAFAETALRRFREGVDLMERGSLREAGRRFTEALEADSSLAEARYDRGLARGAAGNARGAIRDLGAYLEARPEAEDQERIREAIRFLEDPPVRFDPTKAFLLGAIVPGAGHFYTDQPLFGGLLLGVAAGAALSAVFHQRVEVACLTVPQDGVCPDDQIRSTSTERPALVPGLIGVALAAGVSALTARSRASSLNRDGARLRIADRDREQEASAGDGLRLLAPGVAPAPRGVALEVVRLRF